MADDEPVPHVEHDGNGVVKLEGFHRCGEMDGAWAFYRTDRAPEAHNPEIRA